MAANDACVETYNLTNETEASQILTMLQWSGMDKLIITVIVPIICTVGILANLAFLFTVARVRRMQIVTNYYLVNLGVADIVFMTFTMASFLNTYLHSPLRHNVPYGTSAGCWGNIYPIYLSYYSSVLLVTLVSLERFFVICMPIKHRLIKGKARTVKLIAACWGISVVLAALSTPRFGLLKQKCFLWPDSEDFAHLPATRRSCYLISNNLAILAEFIQTISFVVAMVISCITYYKLIRTLSQTPALTWSGSRSTRGRREMRNKKVRNEVARVLIINGIAFFLCQFPARVIGIDKLIRVINGNLQDNYATIFAIASGLLLINSAINPFIYGLSSRFYKVAFCEAFGIATYLKMERSASLVTGGSSFTMSQSNDSSLRIHRNVEMTPSANIKGTTAQKNSSS